MYEKQSICQFALRHAEAPSGMNALVQPGTISWNHAQLQELVAELATKLRALSLCREDTVAVLMPDGAAGLVAQLGVLDVCGCAPMNPSLTVSELRHDLVELGVRAIICPSNLLSGAHLAEELDLMCIFASSTGDTLAWSISSGRKQETGLRCLSKNNAGAAILLHTSATTGRRKIVPLTTANLKASLLNTRTSLRLSQNDRLLVMARLFHAQGILSALSQWSVGGGVVVPSGSEPSALARLIVDQRITWYTCGPTLHQALLKEFQTRGPMRPHCLRFVRSGGNTLPSLLQAALRKELGVPVLDMYGLSETGAVAATPLDEPEARGWRSVGPEICVMSPQGDPLRPGEEGEIVLRGPSVMGGYWNDDEANREAFWTRSNDRWFRSGDLGRMDEAGYLTMSGRAKEIINRGAQKIQPAEVDRALREHPALKAVAAFGTPHPTLGEDVACAVVLHEGASVTEAEVRAFAQKSLARYKVPRTVHFVAEIPYGSTGKPQRLRLKDLLSHAVVSSAGVQPTEVRLNSIESVLTDMWIRRLGSARVGLYDDFFQLGGDSLEAASMLAEVEALLQVRHAPGTTERFLESPNLHTLCALGSTSAELTSTRPGEIRLYPLSAGGTGTSAFLIPADNDQGWYYRSLSRYMGKDRPVSMVRPENGLYGSSPDLIEISAASAVKVIQESLPHGPYLIGGFCLGGVIAYETAYLLEQKGERVLLVLFDSPLPGAPRLIGDFKVWAAHAKELVGAVIRGERRWRNLAGFGQTVLRRILWLILVSAKGNKQRSATGKLLDWLCRESQKGYFPLYMPAFSSMPILHFVVTQETSVLRKASLRAWSRTTSAEMLEVSLTGSHQSMFTDANQVQINVAIDRWASAQTSEKRVGTNGQTKKE